MVVAPAPRARAGPDGSDRFPIAAPVQDMVTSVAGAVTFWATTQLDGVKEFPGPWALVPVGAAMLLILSAANRMADPHNGGRLATPTGCWPPSRS